MILIVIIIEDNNNCLLIHKSQKIELNITNKLDK